MLITTRGTPPSLEVRNPALFNNRFYAFCQVLPPIASREIVASVVKAGDQYGPAGTAGVYRLTAKIFNG